MAEDHYTELQSATNTENSRILWDLTADRWSNKSEPYLHREFLPRVCNSEWWVKCLTDGEGRNRLRFYCQHGFTIGYAQIESALAGSQTDTQLVAIQQLGLANQHTYYMQVREDAVRE